MFHSSINNLFRASKIASSGLQSNRKWLDVIANNLANMRTVDTGTRDHQGNLIPYARQVPIFEKVLSEKFRANRVKGEVKDGVKIGSIHSSQKKFQKIYDPHHPAARKKGTKDAGYVYYPDVDLMQEMVDMRVAQASYEANLTSIEISGKMFEHSLNLGKRG